MRTKDFAHILCKGLAHIATVTQQALHLPEPGFTATQRLQRSFAICHLGRSNGHCVRQSLGVHHDVTFDTRDLLARVIALQGCCVCVFHTLRVNDQERAAGAAPQFLAGRANLIFLMPAPAGCPLHGAHSRSQSMNALCATWEILRATCATDTRS